jgi:gluconolactonase
MLVAVLITLLAADSPIAKGTKPTRIQGTAGEGPAWSPTGSLFFSGQGKIFRRDPDGSVNVFRADSGGSNGLMFDHDGRLIVCEAKNRRITRTELNGSITVLADRFEGHRFNQPNDLTIDSKGRIYFSDPRYGARDGMEMLDKQGKTVEGVYRIDAPGKVSRIITHETDRPNGVLVSPQDEFLYVADNNNNTAGGARKLWRFNLRRDGTIDAASKKLIFDWQKARGPDGVKMDRRGRIYVAAGLNKPHPPHETDQYHGGIYILSADGKLLDFIPIPVDEVTNCAFGNSDLRTLFITAGGTLWSIPVDMPGRVSYER